MTGQTNAVEQLTKQNAELRKTVERLYVEISELKTQIDQLVSVKSKQVGVMLRVPVELRNIDGTSIERQAKLILEIDEVVKL